MTTPGFTAEVALEAAGDPYRTTGARPRADGGVRAAIFRGSCMSRCLASQGDDPFAYQNCHCACFGHPGKTCFLI